MTNKLFTIGRLTADPEIRTISSGASFASFTVASDVRVKEGEKATNFYRVTAWRGLGETCAKFLHKGDRIGVVGDLHLRTFTDKNGVERLSPQVTATDIEFLMNKKTDENTGENNNTRRAPESAQPTNDSEEDDDLPF